MIAALARPTFGGTGQRRRLRMMQIGPSIFEHAKRLARRGAARLNQRTDNAESDIDSFMNNHNSFNTAGNIDTDLVSQWFSSSFPYLAHLLFSDNTREGQRFSGGEITVILNGLRGLTRIEIAVYDDPLVTEALLRSAPPTLICLELKVSDCNAVLNIRRSLGAGLCFPAIPSLQVLTFNVKAEASSDGEDIFIDQDYVDSVALEDMLQILLSHTPNIHTLSVISSFQVRRRSLGLIETLCPRISSLRFLSCTLAGRLSIGFEISEYVKGIGSPDLSVVPDASLNLGRSSSSSNYAGSMQSEGMVPDAFFSRNDRLGASLGSNYAPFFNVRHLSLDPQAIAAIARELDGEQNLSSINTATNAVVNSATASLYASAAFNSSYPHIFGRIPPPLPSQTTSFSSSSAHQQPLREWLSHLRTLDTGKRIVCHLDLHETVNTLATVLRALSEVRVLRLPIYCFPDGEERLRRNNDGGVMEREVEVEDRAADLQTMQGVEEADADQRVVDLEDIEFQDGGDEYGIAMAVAEEKSSEVLMRESRRPRRQRLWTPYDHWRFSAEYIFLLIRQRCEFLEWLQVSFVTRSDTITADGVDSLVGTLTRLKAVVWEVDEGNEAELRKKDAIAMRALELGVNFDGRFPNAFEVLPWEEMFHLEVV